MIGKVRTAAGRDARRAVVITLAAIGASTAVALAAITDNMYPTANYDRGCQSGGGFCRTDNATLTVYRQDSLQSSGKMVIRDTLDNSYNTTDLNVSYPSSPVYSGDGETDIIYQTNPSRVPSGLDGITWCNAVGSSYAECDQHYVAFRSATPSVELACHETGHGVGLTHGANASPQLSNQDSRLACMTTGPILSRWLGSNNVDNINGAY